MKIVMEMKIGSFGIYRILNDGDMDLHLEVRRGDVWENVSGVEVQGDEPSDLMDSIKDLVEDAHRHFVGHFNLIGECGVRVEAKDELSAYLLLDDHNQEVHED